MKLDGKQLALTILTRLKQDVQKLKQEGIIPTLAIVLIGDNQASEVYVKQKELKARDVGIETQIFRFGTDVTNEELEKLIKKLNADPNIHGVILQRPAPEHVEVDRLEEYISPKKEVDGFGKQPAYSVPVAEATFRLIKSAFEQLRLNQFIDGWLKTQKIVVLGKGETAGAPITEYFKKLGNNVTVVDSKTQDRDAVIKNADIVVTAVGKAQVVSSQNLKKGVILVGVGIYRDEDGKLKGDYDEEDVAKVAGFYSPTPGGVGPVNVACLLENVVKASH